METCIVIDNKIAFENHIHTLTTGAPVLVVLLVVLVILKVVLVVFGLVVKVVASHVVANHQNRSTSS